MKVLLFGATGCFGTEFAFACARRNVPVVELSHADIEVTDTSAVERRIRSEAPDAVVNAVALVGINPCEQQPEQAFAVHVAAAQAMCRAAAATDAVYVQTSTHAVFDGLRHTSWVEDDVPDPGSIYGITKLAAEMVTRHQCSRHYVTRFPTLYGRRRNNAPGFVDKALARLAAGEDLRIADDKIDSVSYARDVAETVLDLIVERRPYGIYHIANAGSCSYYDFVMALKTLMHSPSTIHRAKDADFPGLAPKPLRTALLSRRLPPLRPWREALAEFVADVVMAGAR